MDLNYILGRHQFSVHHARSASSPEARHAHRGLAAGYASRIRAFQRDIGARALLGDAL